MPLFPAFELTFSPVVTIAGVDVRLDTHRAGRGDPRQPRGGGADRPPHARSISTRSTEEAGPDEAGLNHLRADDLLYVAVAALPGAVIGGRLGYALVHLDYYTANSSALLDVTQGSLSLSLAVVGGFLTASIVAGLLGAPVGRWMHALVLPLLLALAGGKLAMALGGSGQGVPWGGDWATAYLGPGPWGSLAPAIPSHPSQVYEALATVGVLLVMIVPAGHRRVRAPHGSGVPAGDRPVGRRTGGRGLHVARPGGRRPAAHGAGDLSRDRGSLARPGGRHHGEGRGPPAEGPGWAAWGRGRARDGCVGRRGRWPDGGGGTGDEPAAGAAGGGPDGGGGTGDEPAAGAAGGGPDGGGGTGDEPAWPDPAGPSRA